MNSKLEKQIRRKVNHKADNIKVQALKEFFEFNSKQSFRRRLRIALKIIFKVKI